MMRSAAGFATLTAQFSAASSLPGHCLDRGSATWPLSIFAKLDSQGGCASGSRHLNIVPVTARSWCEVNSIAFFCTLLTWIGEAWQLMLGPQLLRVLECVWCLQQEHVYAEALRRTSSTPQETCSPAHSRRSSMLSRSDSHQVRQPSCMKRTICLPVHRSVYAKAPAKPCIHPQGHCDDTGLWHMWGSPHTDLAPRQLKCSSLRHLQSGAAEAASGAWSTWKVCVWGASCCDPAHGTARFLGFDELAEAGHASATTWRMMHIMLPYRDLDTPWRTCTA